MADSEATACQWLDAHAALGPVIVDVFLRQGRGLGAGSL
jgi:hypothetical protein